MAYTTVEEVEARLGFQLPSELEAQRLELFLEDFKTFLDTLLTNRGINPATVSPDLLKMISANHGRDYALMADHTPGLNSISEANADVSTVISYRDTSGRRYRLDDDEKEMLGLNKRRIGTIQMTNGRDGDRYDGWFKC